MQVRLKPLYHVGLYNQFFFGRGRSNFKLMNIERDGMAKVMRLRDGKISFVDAHIKVNKIVPY